MEEFSEDAREDSSLPGSDDFHSQEQFPSAPSVNYAPFALDLVPTLGDLVPSSSSVPLTSQVGNFAFQTVPACGIPPAANANADVMTGASATFRKAPFGCDASYQYQEEKFGVSAYQPTVLRNSICLQNTNNSNGASLQYGPVQGSAYHQAQISSCQSAGPYPGSLLQQSPKFTHETELPPRFSTGKRSPEKGRKAAKKRKKKGIDEPQRPVSAYALFFRDTQAAIKTENSAATFGEISKIVASMWDNLSEQAKQVYKQKTENAKREYLKHLAAFRANMISKEISSASRLLSSPASQTEIYVMSKGTQEPKSTSAMAGHPGVSTHLSFPVTHLDGVLSQPLYQNTQATLQNMPMGNSISSSTLTTPASTTNSQGSHYLPGTMATSLILPDMLQTTKGTGEIYLASEQNNHANSIIQNLTTTTAPATPCTTPALSTCQETSARYCMRPGCGNLAMVGPYSESNYCSNDCAYGHIHCS